MSEASGAGVHPYVNAVRAVGGPFDVMVEFGRTEAGSDEPESVTGVVMSWEHARVMRDSLNLLIEGFENSVGEIPDVANRLTPSGGGQ